MKQILQLEKVEKYYGSRSSLTKAVDKVSFAVEPAEFVAIMGASGSGKTTLLNCIATIDRVTAGKIIVDGIDITALKGEGLNRFRRENLGFIFQDFNLLDTLSIEENIALPLAIKDIPAKEIKSTVRRASPYSTPRGAGTPSNTILMCRIPTRATMAAAPSRYGR